MLTVVLVAAPPAVYALFKCCCCTHLRNVAGFIVPAPTSVL